MLSIACCSSTSSFVLRSSSPSSSSSSSLCLAIIAMAHSPHSRISSPPWPDVRPIAVPDRDPDAPDDDPSAPLSVLAPWILSVSTPVNYRRTKALELWHYAMDNIVRLALLLTSAILDKSFVVGGIYSGICYVRFQVEPTFRVFLTTWNYMFGFNLLQRLGSCDDTQIVVSDHESTVGHRR